MGKAGLIKKIGGAIIILFSIILPAITMNSMRPGIGMGVLSLITIAVIAVIALSIFVIRWMNNGTTMIKVLGYLIFVVIATLPGIAMTSVDKSYNALGTAYYNAVIISILTWWGFFLITRKPSDH